ncbi:MAG: AAA family ATPase, partial [Marmoricola sp.]
MRLHHLTIQAFGPFGGSVDIDFDELNAAGQFLISGATGAGKTSILDAVCFALYGEVPGERQRAKHLRSDHAEAGAEPRVTLTLTVADRLVRISRSPAWERPKRRGTGLTPQQASVRLEQELEGEWRCLATRLDEAGHLVNTWLGMTPVQFTQVALLPQGGFQTFLQSPTAARQAVLQRLFRTDRFERVERWFADFRRTLNRARTDALHQIDVVTHRLAEASGSDDAPAPDAGVDALVAWADARSLALDEAQAVAGADYEEAASRQARAAHDLQEATALVTVLDRAADAQEQLADLAATASAFEDDLLALHAHDRATSLAPLIRSSAEAETIAARARRHALTALREAGLGGDESDDDLAEQAASAREAVQHAERTQALATKVAALRTDEAQADRATEAAAAALAELTAAGQSLPAQRLALVAELQSAIAAQGDLAACVVEVEVAEQGLDAARDLEIAAADLAEKVDLRRLQQDQVLELRQQYQDAREARIEAMAAELARGLVVGCSCPVCGSTAHPSPAASVTSVGRR